MKTKLMKSWELMCKAKAACSLTFAVPYLKCSKTCEKHKIILLTTSTIPRTLTVWISNTFNAPNLQLFPSASLSRRGRERERWADVNNAAFNFCFNCNRKTTLIFSILIRHISPAFPAFLGTSSYHRNEKQWERNDMEKIQAYIYIHINVYIYIYIIYIYI